MSRIAPLPPLDSAQRYSILEAAHYLRICRAYLYELLDRGEIRSICDGKRRYIPGSEIARRSALPEQAAP